MDFAYIPTKCKKEKISFLANRRIKDKDQVLKLCLQYFTFTRLKRLRHVNSDFYRVSSIIQQTLAKPLTLNAQVTPFSILKENLSSFLSTFGGKNNRIPFARFYIDLSKNIDNSCLLWRHFFQRLQLSSCFSLAIGFNDLTDASVAILEEAAAMRSAFLALPNLHHLSFKIQFQKTFDYRHVNLQDLLLKNPGVHHLQVEMVRTNGRIACEELGIKIIRGLELWNPPTSSTYLTELTFEFVPISASFLHELSTWNQRVKKLKLGLFEDINYFNICQELEQVLLNFAACLIEFELVLKYEVYGLESTAFGNLKFPTMPFLETLKISCEYSRKLQFPYLANDVNMPTKLPKLSTLMFENLSWARGLETYSSTNIRFNTIRCLHSPIVEGRVTLASNSAVFTTMFPNLTKMCTAMNAPYLQLVFSLCPLLMTLNIYRITDNISLDDIFTGVPKVNQFCRGMGLSPRDDFRPYITESLPSLLLLRDLERLELNVKSNVLLSDVSIYNVLLRLQNLSELIIIVSQYSYEPLLIFSEQGKQDLKNQMKYTQAFNIYTDITC